MVQDDIKRNLFKVAVFGTLAYATFKLLTGGKKEKSVSSVVSNVVKPVEIVAKTADKVAKKAVRFVKGSPEAKEYMASIRAKSKGVKKGEGKKAKSKAHKGHATKKGLAQDQKLVSSEKHEKDYQKSVTSNVEK
jgi:hypothetical protein